MPLTFGLDVEPTTYGSYRLTLTYFIASLVPNAFI